MLLRVITSYHSNSFTVVCLVARPPDMAGCVVGLASDICLTLKCVSFLTYRLPEVFIRGYLLYLKGMDNSLVAISAM
jgi:hypothetical protein